MVILLLESGQEKQLTMQNPKRHHYIPQMLLRRFTDEDGKLYFFYKGSPGKVIESNPKDTFVKQHLYTQHDQHGNKDVSVEEEFSKLEAQASPIIEKIIQATRYGKLPHLTSAEKEIWDEFFCSQWIRIPKWQEDMQKSNLVSDALQDFEREVRPLTEAEREQYSQPQEQKK